MAMNQEVYVKGLRFAGGNAFRCHGYNSSLISGRTSGLITLGEMGGRS
jgi:hypothetical protein